MEKPLGSSGAVKALLAGTLDIAVSSKTLKPDEISAGAMSAEYGRTPLAIVSGSKVDKTVITTQELEDIYSRKIRSWPNGEPVRIILRPESDIDTLILATLSAEMAKSIRIAHAQHGMISAIADPESDEAVARTPGSLGASALPGLMDGKSRLNILALNGVKPTFTNLGEGDLSAGKGHPFHNKEGHITRSGKIHGFHLLAPVVRYRGKMRRPGDTCSNIPINPAHHLHCTQSIPCSSAPPFPTLPRWGKFCNLTAVTRYSRPRP